MPGTPDQLSSVVIRVVVAQFCAKGIVCGDVSAKLTQLTKSNVVIINASTENMWAWRIDERRGVACFFVNIRLPLLKLSLMKLPRWNKGVRPEWLNAINRLAG